MARPALLALVVGASTLFVLQAGPVQAAGKAVDGVVNLNTATPELLALLPGIGPARVERVLAYRKRRPFRTVDELVRIKGIGRKMVRALRPHLAVTGPTTATAARGGHPGASPPAAAPAARSAAPPNARPAPARACPPAVGRRPPGPGRPAPPRTAAARLAAAVPLAARGHCLRPP